MNGELALNMNNGSAALEGAPVPLGYPEAAEPPTGPDQIEPEIEKKENVADRVSFIAEGHSTRLLNKMAYLRDEGRHLCDVVLQLGSRKIYAHRVVLSACSNYFCAMFTNTMLESKQDTITLSDMDEKVVEELVEFAYTAKINIHEDNVQPLLKAASILQLSDVTGACSDFLKQQLHPSNCLGIANFAEVHGCTALAETSQLYVLDHFMDVVHFDEYLQLSVEGVKQLLLSDALSVHSEEQVFESMHKWLTYNTQGRKQYAHELLSCIRLPLLKPLYLAEQVYAKEVYSHHQRSTELIMKAMIYHTLQEKKSQMRSVINDRPRKGTIGTMFAIGGMDTSRNKGSIECFDARKDTWKWVCHSQAACRRLQFGVAVMNSKIYVVGGRNGLRTLNTVDCYDPTANSWDSVPPMCSYRHGVGVGVMSGPMYAVGGHDGWSYLSSVER
jgi:kelch-like protein 1/4/5